MKHQSLYFIAITPPFEIKTEIQELTEKISHKYDTKKALNSEPHITLIPPFWFPDAKIDHLKNSVSELRKETWPFTIIIKGFDTFPSRVLFLNVVMSDELQECYERTHAYLPKDTRSKIKKYKEFHPHITVAFKDISQENFIDAQKEYLSTSYERAFELSAINLYKHDGMKWKKVKV